MAPPTPIELTLKKSFKSRGKPITYIGTLNLTQYCVLVAAEFLGSFIFVFIGCLSTAPLLPLSHLQVAFAFGLAALIVVATFAHISGSNITLVVTITVAVLGHIPLVTIPVYFFSQIVGGFAGFMTVLAVVPQKYWDHGTHRNGTMKGIGLCSPHIHPDAAAWQGMITEYIAASFLTLLTCAVKDHRNAHLHDSVAIKFGLLVVAVAITCGALTGCNINPARSLPPAVINGYWKNHWIYWVGPICGAFFTSVFYRFIFQTPSPEEESQEEK